MSRHYLANGAVNSTPFARANTRDLLPTKPTTAESKDSPVTDTIANGQLADRRQCVVEHIAPIILRSNQIMMTSALISDLHRVDAGGKAASPTWDLKTSYVPEDYRLWPSADVCVKADMLDLYHEGYQVGYKQLWVDGVPSPGVSSYGMPACHRASIAARRRFTDICDIWGQSKNHKQK